MNHLPTFKIFGTERRKLKKELSLLQSYLKNFWYCHGLDKDMASFYGGSKNYPMSDEVAKQKYIEADMKVKNLQQKLAQPYS